MNIYNIIDLFPIIINNEYKKNNNIGIYNIKIKNE